MKNILFENSSLNEICTALSSGIVEIKNPDNVFITSKIKKGYIIQFCELSCRDQIAHLLRFKDVIPTEISKVDLMVETSCYNFIVSTLTKDKNGRPLYTVMSLMELILMTNNILQYEDGTELSPDDKWSLEEPIWDCYEFLPSSKSEN